MRVIKFLIMFILLMNGLSLAEDSRKRIHSYKEKTLQKEDVEAEVLFGRELAVKIVGTYPLLKDEAKTKYVNLVGRQLANYGSRQEIEFHFGILDTDIVNAFSAPGGYVFITRGCLDLMEDEAELAGVLAHEIAHINQMHILKDINLKTGKAEGLAYIIKSPMGTVEDITLTLLDSAYKVLFEKGYQLQQEYEADMVGTQMLLLSNYDPSGLKRFLEKVAEKGFIKQIEKTHPNVLDRVKALSEFLEKNDLHNKDLPRNKERFEKFIKGNI